MIQKSGSAWAERVADGKELWFGTIILDLVPLSRVSRVRLTSFTRVQSLW